MGDDEDKVLEEESKNWGTPSQKTTDDSTDNATTSSDDGDFTFHPFANSPAQPAVDTKIADTKPAKSPFDDDEEDLAPDTIVGSPVVKTDSETKDDATFTVDDVKNETGDTIVNNSEDKKVETTADLSSIKTDFDKAASDIKAGIDKMSSILSDLIAKSDSLEKSNQSLEDEKTKLEAGIAKVKDAFSTL
ncbi:MAG: hypothetical protein WCG48_00690 [Candidatus Berkelbacteria bacterium]